VPTSNLPLSESLPCAKLVGFRTWNCFERDPRHERDFRRSTAWPFWNRLRGNIDANCLQAIALSAAGRRSGVSQSALLVGRAKRSGNTTSAAAKASERVIVDSIHGFVLVVGYAW